MGTATSWLTPDATATGGGANGYASWTNPDNALTDNNSYATNTFPDGSTLSRNLSFAFDASGLVPEGNEVVGFEAEARAFSNGGGTWLKSTSLSLSGDLISFLIVNSGDNFTTSELAKTLGGDGVMYLDETGGLDDGDIALPLTRQVLEDAGSSLRAQFTFESGISPRTFSLDAVRIRFFYDPAALIYGNLSGTFKRPVTDGIRARHNGSWKTGEAWVKAGGVWIRDPISGG